MNISGFEILVENSHWVHDDILYSQTYKDLALAKISTLLENPDYPAYAMVGEFFKIKAFRFDHVRIYVRVYEAARVVGILAACAAGDVKRNELSGAMTNQFIGHLQRFRGDSIPASLYPWPEDESHDINVIEPERPLPDWTIKAVSLQLTEEQAMKLLSDSRPSRGKNARVVLGDYAEGVMDLVGRAYPGDRILAPLPERNWPWEKREIAALRASLIKALKFFEKRYSVRYDDISQKFVLTPRGMVSVGSPAERVTNIYA